MGLLREDLLDDAECKSGLDAESNQKLLALRGETLSVSTWVPEGDGSGSFGNLASGSSSDLGLFCRVLQGFLLRADFITKLRTALSGLALTPWSVLSMNMNCIGFFACLRLPPELGLFPLAFMNAHASRPARRDAGRLLAPTKTARLNGGQGATGVLAWRGRLLDVVDEVQKGNT